MAGESRSLEVDFLMFYLLLVPAMLSENWPATIDTAFLHTPTGGDTIISPAWFPPQ